MMVKLKVFGALGVFISLAFFLGFIILFILNPLTFEEINNICITSYNIVGMEYRLWAVIFTYLFIGVLSILFATGLFLYFSNKSIIVLGKIFILLSGIVWLSFGIINYIPQDEFSNDLMLIRIVSSTVINFLGLIFLCFEFELISNDGFLKWFTIFSGSTILGISLLSIFYFNDETWIRTNLSITLYFIWYAVFGFRIIYKN